MKKELRIRILQTDARHAGDYVNGHECLVATAFRRQFPAQSRILGRVGSDYIVVGGEWCYFDPEAVPKIHDAYRKHIYSRVFRGFKPFTIIATRNP